MRKMFLSILAILCLTSGIALASDSGASGSLSAPYENSGTDDTGDDFLSTLFANDNNYAGNSFDISGITPVTVVGFDVNLDVILANYTIDVWYREGTADGFEQNVTGWTLLGSEVVVPAGADNPTHVNVGGLMIGAGETYGMIITAQEAVSGTGGFMYTNGGPNTYTNANMEIVTYRGLSEGFPPASVFTYRAWNGTVHYDYGVSLESSTWGEIKATF